MADASVGNDTSSEASTKMSSGCPVRRETNENSTTKEGIGFSFRSWLGVAGRANTDGTMPGKQTPLETQTRLEEPSQCPINQPSLPASVEESLQHNQRPIYPDQTIPLSTHRVISSIPRSNQVDAPDHQKMLSSNPNELNTSKTPNNWVYPSEQQFYNAMRKKGWDAPDEQDMYSVIQIHNAVNEQSWKEVKRWEKEMHDCDNPKLVRFMGRPKDLSPKAWIYSNLLFYKAPFDRHDWYVESERNRSSSFLSGSSSSSSSSSSSNNNNTNDINEGEKDVVITRYVIDFYEGKSAASNSNKPNSPMLSPVSMYLDVRPALDHPNNFIDRAKMALKDMLPGIFPPNST